LAEKRQMFVSVVEGRGDPLLFSTIKTRFRRRRQGAAEDCPNLFVGLGLNVGWRRVKQQTGVSLSKADSGVDADDFMKVSTETPLKTPRSSIGGSKLGLQGFPWNQAWPPEVAHHVGEPDVDIDCQWRALQEFDPMILQESLHGISSDLVSKVGERVLSENRIVL